ncbi:MAG: glycosyltransferase, partial [Nanoarchaeota archaeon]
QHHKARKFDTIIIAVKNLKCDLFLFGETNENLVPIAGNNVHFMGEVDPSEIFYILKQADILVNNMDADCNFKLFDYMSVGKPIITADGMVRNVLTHKKDAILTKNFRKDIKNLIDNKKLREVLERNIKKIKIKTWEGVAEIHLKLYHSLIKKDKPTSNILPPKEHIIPS